MPASCPGYGRQSTGQSRAATGSCNGRHGWGTARSRRTPRASAPPPRRQPPLLLQLLLPPQPPGLRTRQSRLSGLACRRGAAGRPPQWTQSTSVGGGRVGAAGKNDCKLNAGRFEARIQACHSRSKSGSDMPFKCVECSCDLGHTLAEAPPACPALCCPAARRPEGHTRPAKLPLHS